MFISSKVPERALSNSSILISKTKILGFGINMQNCNNQIHASMDFSFESLYQSIRRSYRFGQKKEVNVFRFGMNPFDDDHETLTLDGYSRMVQDVKRELIETSFEEEE